MKLLNYITFIFIGSVAYSQGLTLDPLRKADAFYQQFSYSKAADFYKIALGNNDIDDDRNGYIINQIALSFRNLNNSDSSEVWFKKSIDHESADDPANYYMLGESLMENAKYSEAKYWFTAYQKSSPNDDRVSKKLEAIDNISQFSDPLFDAEIEKANFNSPGLDFSPAFYQKGIVFVSSRPKKGWIQKEFNWDESTFLDLYKAESGDSSDASIFDEGLNTPYHEGSLVFYNDGRSVVFTRNNYDGKKLGRDEKGIANLKIFFASWDANENKWVDEIPFKYNSDDYSNGAPAISENGKVLIYSSNMEGGFGASDLYISYKQTDGWSKPMNLGSEVNTKGRDGFAFLDKQKLFFASDGREGLGGLDIYSVAFDGNSVVGLPENVGQPFNSNKDDFGLIIRESEGYFTSNRDKENGDDIYKILVKTPKYYVVKGEVYDEGTNLGIDKADVFFRNKKGEYLYTRSNPNGEYEILAPLNTPWSVFAGKFQYDRLDSLDVELTENDTINLRRIYLRKEGTFPSDSMDLTGITPVVDNRVKPYEESSHFVDGFDLNDTLKFDIIYYDLDKSTLRPLSKEVLDKAANFMIEHVDVRIVLQSHTDSRANNLYNKSLSKRRSNAAYKYLVEMGVNPERISRKNMGEETLANQCIDGETCSDDEHQLNRRTEISFVKQDI